MIDLGLEYKSKYITLGTSTSCCSFYKKSVLLLLPYDTICGLGYLAGITFSEARVISQSVLYFHSTNLIKNTLNCINFQFLISRVLVYRTQRMWVLDDVDQLSVTVTKKTYENPFKAR